jgi:capsular exopolysaccharide synthesis family protein
MSNIVASNSAPVLPAASPPPPEGIWIDAYLDERQSEFLRYGRVLLKRIKLVLAVAAAVLGITIGWTFMTTPTYTSSANIQIESEQHILPYNYGVITVVPDSGYLGTQSRVLSSEMLAQRVVTRLKLANDPAKIASVGRWFARHVDVQPVIGTQILKVSYKADEPEFAAQAVNALVDEYADYGLESKRESSLKARDFLQSELTRLQQKMQQSEQRLVDYGRTHNILEPTRENNIVTRRLTELHDEMTKVEAELLANQYKELQNTPIESFPDQLKTPVTKTLESRRSDIEQKLATLTLKFGSRWPEVVALNEQLNDVRHQLDTEKSKAIRQAEVQYNLAIVHQRRLMSATREQQALADQLTEDSIQYDMLKREVDADRQLHEGLLQRMKETDISAGLNAGNVQVIDRGHVSRVPTSPNIVFNLSLGLVFGLVAGFGAAMTVEILYRRIKTPEDVERELHVPFLAAVPAFEKRWNLETGGHLLPLNVSTPPQLRASGHASVYWESYRALRTSLLFSPDNRPHTVLITSAITGEGKTTTAVNLAIALAHTGARTLLLETDLRHPQLADRLGLRGDVGISRYLAGQNHFHTEIQPSTIQNLFVVTSGPVPPNPPELLGSARMLSALELLKRHFDIVIIDSPPVTPVTDALVLAPHVSGVVLVVGSRTSVTAAQAARNHLRSVNANVLGVLVNSVKIDLTDAYGSYYHESPNPEVARPS